MEINNTQDIKVSEPVSAQTQSKKHFKSFWPVMIIATLSALVGGLVVWSVNNTNLEQDALSLLPGSSYSKVHEQIEKEKISQNETYGMLAEAGDVQANNWMIYKNEEHGFELSFPPTWKGYKVLKEEMSSNFGAGTYIFLIPTTSKIYSGSHSGYAPILTVNVYNKDYWQKIQAEEGPKPGYLGQNSRGQIFAYFGWQDAPEDLVNINFDAQKVLDSFKLIP